MNRLAQYSLITITAMVLCSTFVALNFAGCVSTGGKDKVALPDDLPNMWSSTVDEGDIPITVGFLDLIGEDALRDLVQEALANNSDLLATAMRLQASRHMLAAPRSRLVPQVTAAFSKNRTNQGLNTDAGQPVTVDSHRINAGVQWEIDLWGRLADAYSASKTAVRAEEYDYQFARDALAVRVVQAWIEQGAHQRLLRIEEERVHVLERIESVLVERYREGLGNLEELSTAKSRTEIARADWSSRRADYIETIRRLEVLVGRYPKGGLMGSETLPQVTPLRAGVPATVLLNRPDIRSALARAESARKTWRAAQKARLPEVQLSAQLFREGALLSELGNATTYWNLIGSLLQPLYDGGQRREEAQARRQEANAGLMDVRTAVFQALKEVEDGYSAERALATQAAALKNAYQESAKSSAYFRERYRQGLDTIQTLLIAQEQEMLVRMRLSGIEAQRLTNRIDLALALGNGIGEENINVAGGSIQ